MDEWRAIENEMERQRLGSSQVRMARGGEGSGRRGGRSQKEHRNEQ